MINTTYSEPSNSRDPIIVSPESSCQNSHIHSLYSDPQYFKYVRLTKKKQLRQINLIMRQKINNMTDHFDDLQKSFANKFSLSKKVRQRVQLKRQRFTPDHGFKNTISTQLDQIFFDQTQPEITFCNYDSAILAQKDIKQKIFDVYDMIQKSQNSDLKYKFDIKLEQYGRSPKVNDELNEQYGKIVKPNQLYMNSSIEPRWYLKKDYIAYNNQDSSERRINENQMSNKQKSNNKIGDMQDKCRQVDLKNISTFKKSHKNKSGKKLYKAIQDRIITSSCTFNSIPMSKEVDKSKYLATRMNKQTIQRDNLIQQFKRSYQKN